jgi:magnesium chelatase family protein
MVLTVPPLPKEALLEQTNSSAESSEVIRERVLKAHNIQFKRQGKFNDKLTPDEIEKSIPLKIGRKSGLLGSTGQMNNAIFQGLTQDF